MNHSRKPLLQGKKGKKTEAEKLKGFTADKNQDIYSYHDVLNAEPKQY